MVPRLCRDRLLILYTLIGRRDLSTHRVATTGSGPHIKVDTAFHNHHVSSLVDICDSSCLIRLQVQHSPVGSGQQAATVLVGTLQETLRILYMSLSS